MEITAKSVMDLKPFSISLGIWGFMAAFDLFGMSGVDSQIFRLFGVLALGLLVMKERGCNQ